MIRFEFKEYAAPDYQQLSEYDIINWDEISAIFSRKDFDGIINSFSNDIEIDIDSDCGIALRQNFMRMIYGQEYGMRMNILKRQEDWTWKIIFSKDFDFATYSENDLTISIKLVDSDIAEKINANKSQVYDIFVDEIQQLDSGNIFNEKRFYYKPLKLFSQVKYIPIGNESTTEANTYTFQLSSYEGYASLTDKRRPFFYKYNDNTVINTAVFEDQEFEDLIFAAKEDVIDFELNIQFDFVATMPNPPTYFNKIFILAERESYDSEWKYLTDVNKYAGIAPSWKSVNELIQKPLIKKGYQIRAFFGLYTNSPVKIEPANFEVKFNTFSIKYKSIKNPFFIEGFYPICLLQALVNKITRNNNTKVKIQLEEPFNTVFRNTMLAAGESIRGIPVSKVHTSFSKFAQFMMVVFGAVQTIERQPDGSETVCFKSRNLVFDENTIKKIEEYNEYELKVNEKLLYSGMHIGFEKQEYENINGRDEYRFGIDYKTNNLLSDNILNIVSPYRSDAYGIEFLTHEREKDTTDNNSDSDIFMVYIKIEFVSSGMVAIPRATIYNNKDYLDQANKKFGVDYYSGGSIDDINSIYMFNAPYSPRLCAQANRRYIASFTNNLYFTATEGNSNAFIQTVDNDGNEIRYNENENVEFHESERLFIPVEARFTTPDNEIPENLDGLISIQHKGETISGFILDAQYNIGKEETVNYNIIVKSIE